ncbi:hypothetical protein GCM10010458_16280 [Microbacterium luteolum]|uniref:AAA family ATPase n=1 Tax=Microbacterium luteolum TaxID=69367 RepID=A0ABY7XQG3_MICLT|nr:AAA family ATPase [Microbacterium luteolum]WDM44334.1 AAA family ATPase [Microbacterium luteolum]
MKLITFTLEGYRRFLAPTSVKLHSDLIAFVGPNEAGKSSLLRALTHLNHDESFDRSEHPRRSVDTVPSLRWQLQLEEEDRQAIEHIRGGGDVEKIVVSKIGTGGRVIDFHPSRPSRDPKPRVALGDLMDELRPALARMAEYVAVDLGLIDGVIATLAEGEMPTAIGSLDIIADSAEGAAGVLEAGAIDAATFPNEAISVWPDQLRSLVADLRASVQEEAEPEPAAVAAAVLLARLPDMRLLGPEDHNLRSEYDLESEADQPSAALAHLARLAQLDLVALRQEVRDANHADVSTRRTYANDRLREVYAESWNQENIALQIDVQNGLLVVQVTTPNDKGYSSLADRSDGLRWFAALLAFTHGGRGRPILLADEIETHLHYDAQADLVGVLARQEYTSKVLYTTHSFGCLPHDLGNGVRVVEPIDAGTSLLRNGFWEAGAGFSPLLKSMGAVAATFTPARHALIGEGPCEAILLPTLLRQAAGRERIKFQIVPGLSSVASVRVAELVSQAGQVAFIVDGDPGGLENKKKLIKAGVDPSRVLVLNETDGAGALELEDLIHPDLYAQCVMEEADCWSATKTQLDGSALPESMRTKAVELWATVNGVAAPDKVAVAQRVANLSADREIFDPNRRELLKELLGSIELALQV